MTELEEREPWLCVRCVHLLPPDITGFHACGRPWPALSRAQEYQCKANFHLKRPAYIGTPKQVRGESDNDPIECATFEDAT